MTNDEKISMVYAFKRKFQYYTFDYENSLNDLGSKDFKSFFSSRISILTQMLEELKELGPVTKENSDDDICYNLIFSVRRLISLIIKRMLSIDEQQTYDVIKDNIGLKNNSEWLVMFSYINNGDDIQKKQFENIYSMFSKSISGKDKLLILQDLSNNELVRRDYNNIINSDIDVHDIMELIAKFDDTNLARRFIKSDKYKEFRKSGAVCTPNFQLTLLGKNPTLLYYYLMFYDKMRASKDPTAYRIEEGIAKKLIESDSRFGERLLEGKLDLKKASIFTLMEHAKKVYKCKDKKVLKMAKKAKDIKHASRIVGGLGSIEAIREFYKKKFSSLGKREMICFLQCMGSEKAVIMEDLINAGEPPTVVEECLDSYDDVEKFRESIRTIKGINDISKEELINNPDIRYIKMEYGRNEPDYYNKAQFIELQDAFNKIFGDIPKADPKDVKSQIEVFKDIFKRTKKHVKYDLYAVTHKGEKDKKLQVDCRSLYNALVKGKAVCAGMAKVIKSASMEKGIECNYVVGFLRGKLANKIVGRMLGVSDAERYAPEEFNYVGKSTIVYKPKILKWAGKCFYDRFNGCHAWNQIKIGDKYFNVDVTNHTSVRPLRSDSEFTTAGERYYIDRHRGEETRQSDEKYEDFLKRHGLKSRNGHIVEMAKKLTRKDLETSYGILKGTLFEIGREVSVEKGDMEKYEI